MQPISRRSNQAPGVIARRRISRRGNLINNISTTEQGFFSNHQG